MDEGAGDQLDNSNLQDQAEKGGEGSSSNEQQSAAAAAAAQQQHHHHQQQQQLNSHDQLHLQQQNPSSSSTTTKNNSNANANNTNNNNSGGGGISNNKQTTTSSITSASSSLNPNTTTTTHNPAEDLFSTKKWGVTPIRQDTPWELPPSPTSSHQSSHSNQLQQHQHHQLPSASSGQAVSSASTANNNATNMNMNSSAAVAAVAANQVAANLAAVSASPFANHNLMNAPGAPVSMQKSMLNSTGNGGQSSFVVGGGMGGLASSIVGGGNGNNNGAVGGGLVGGGNGGVNSGIMQQGESFARAPGPASSIMDNNITSNKPFGMASRSSTWSAFGSTVPSEPESEWPKSTNTNSGISVGNSSQQQQQQQQQQQLQQQQSGSFDLMPDFDSGKSWHGSMLMKNLDDDSSINSNSASISAFASAYAAATSKSPTGSQYEPSGIGTWSPVVKGGRPGSKWDGDGPDNGRGDNGRFDDGTAIWGSPAQNKIAGVDWVVKSGDANSNNDKSRSMAGNNQNYRPQQSSSSTSLLMSSNTSPSSQQHNRNPQTLKQPLLSHNFDQVQQQSNALSSQPNQPNRATGLSNVPSTQQLKHMVQQIQLAVQAGHLNPQILNQPLAPVTLQLLYQLLQQIKVLHQLQMTATQQFNKPGSHPATVNVHITKTKQSILNLQNQIAAQQAAYLKQTQGHNISSRQPAMPNLATGGMGGGIGPALPPGISQSGDSFRSGTSVNEFAHGQAMVNNFGVDSMNANGLANSLGHMNLGGAGGVLHSSRFDQPWRAPSTKQHQQPSMASSSPFANHNLMNPGAPGSMQKSMLNSSGNGGSSFGGGMQQGESFARAPGPASSIMDNNMASNKPFGMASRSSTWSAFGSPVPNEQDSEWPKSTTSGFSMGNSTQPSNAFDLVPEFEPGKPWRGSMLMKSVEDDPTMTPGSMARSLAPQRKTIWSDEVL